MAQRDRDVLKPLRLATARLRRALPPLLLVLCSARGVLAGPHDARVLPAHAELSPGVSSPAAAAEDERVRQIGAAIDGTLREAAVDLGLNVLEKPAPAGEPAPPAVPPESWVVAPSFRLDDETLGLKLVAVAPGSRVELVREEELPAADLAALDVRVVVMLRDLYETGRAALRSRVPERRPVLPAPAEPPRSSGRPVLALNAAVLGGYVGFTIQRASGSADSRLVYPLVALGAGLGVGASLLVADEWDIGVGDAWYLSAGATWPALSGILLAESYGASPNSRYLYGLSAATAGISLGAIAIAVEPMGEGGAVLAHSGGTFGALLGAMTQIGWEGKTGEPLTRGIGYGAGAGVLLGGILATQLTASPSRVLLVDLSASLGWLSGAALASPLLLTDESDPTRTRIWLASAGAGTIAGAVIGWYVTSPRAGAAQAALPCLPYANLAPTAGGSALELGLHGRW